MFLQGTLPVPFITYSLALLFVEITTTRGSLTRLRALEYVLRGNIMREDKRFLLRSFSLEVIYSEKFTHLTYT